MSLSAPTTLSDVAVMVPTYQGGQDWLQWIDHYQRLRYRPAEVLVIDSGSHDGTAEAAQAAGFTVQHIDSRDFNHGATRQQGADYLQRYPFVVYLTQDAWFADPEALWHLRQTFNDPSVGAAYGRQLPRPGAGVLGAHARLFNYPATSRRQSRASIPQQGIKASFMSNSFAAYRQSALREIGGFPAQIILGEDAWVGGRLVLAGHDIAYCAEAQVFHSHDYSLWQEMSRYFDIGVFHQQAAWLKREFGAAEGEGARFVRSEWAYLWQHQAWRLPEAAARTVLKYIGYRLGQSYQRLPQSLCQRLSMHRRFWSSNA